MEKDNGVLAPACLQVGGGERLKRQRSIEGSGSFRAEPAGSKADQDREKNELVKEEHRWLEWGNYFACFRCSFSLSSKIYLTRLVFRPSFGFAALFFVARSRYLRNLGFAECLKFGLLCGKPVTGACCYGLEDRSTPAVVQEYGWAQCTSSVLPRVQELRQKSSHCSRAMLQHAPRRARELYGSSPSPYTLLPALCNCCCSCPHHLQASLHLGWRLWREIPT